MKFLFSCFRRSSNKRRHSPDVLPVTRPSTPMEVHSVDDDDDDDEDGMYLHTETVDDVPIPGHMLPMDILQSPLQHITLEEAKKLPYVIVNCEGQFFPGKVLRVKKSSCMVTVKRMSPDFRRISDGACFKWPVQEKKNEFHINSVKMVIEVPEVVSGDGEELSYYVPSLDCVWAKK